LGAMAAPPTEEMKGLAVDGEAIDADARAAKKAAKQAAKAAKAEKKATKAEKPAPGTTSCFTYQTTRQR
jgi:hypothetical protein